MAIGSQTATSPETLAPAALIGPGVITGAADDDPSGIATYSQAGAQFGYGMLWSIALTYPLMAAAQEIAARIGRTTGRGIAGNLIRTYPNRLVYLLVAIMTVANLANLGADLGAMGSAVQLLAGGPAGLYVVGFALLSIALEVFLSYARYAAVLKWLTLSLLAYAASLFVIDVPWLEVLHQTVWPPITFSADYATLIVGVLGTTISPYLFFWQAGLEVEDLNKEDAARPLRSAPQQAPGQLRRIRIDTLAGMGFSNIVAFFIIVTTAATLHAHGQTDIQSASQAAEALRPIAGRFAFTLFALGIIGTGLLALPVLAGSSAYAIGEISGWRVGLDQAPGRAKRFYGAIALATLLGMAMNFVGIDPIKALIWSAILNGVAAVPIMAMMMRLVARPDVMHQFVAPRGLLIVGWLATAAMTAAVLVMTVTSFL
jgi:NRAMP (natural resistance-associated macrophage protein)-like metal ion transporter